MKFSKTQNIRTAKKESESKLWHNKSFRMSNFKGFVKTH